MGTDGSAKPTTVTVGTGLSLSGGTLTATAGGAVTQLAQTTLASPTSGVTFSTISGSYSALEIDVNAASSYAGFDNIKIVINSDTSADYIVCTLNVVSGSSPSSTCSTTAASNIQLGISTTTGIASSFLITIPNYANTTLDKNLILTGGGLSGNATNNAYTQTANVVWKSTSAITSIAFTTANAANFVAGSQFTLYGKQ
jgi:hypothetical protein